MSGDVGVIIPAAGSGKRLGGISKPLIEVKGKPLIHRLLGLFRTLKGMKVICLAVPRGEISAFRKIVASLKMDSTARVIEGGTERALSVKLSFDTIRDSLADGDLVCIHDAARPLLSKTDLERVIDAGRKHGAALLATKVKDTLKRVDERGFCKGTIDRESVYAAQTPQVIKMSLLSAAYERTRDLSGITDEIMLMEKIGRAAFVVEPQDLNFKITTPEDLELLKKIIS